MTHSLETLLGWRGRTAYDAHGEKLGKIGDLYLDGVDDVPAYAGVRTGLLGRHESIVPLAGAEERDGDVHVPYGAELVRDAPSLDPDAALDEEQEHALAEHYGARHEQTDAGDAHDSEASDLRRAEPRDTHDSEASDTHPGAVGDTDAPGEDSAESPNSMVRSEEEVQLRQGELRPSEKVRLRKVMVTEQVEKTVPVRREVIQLEHEPAPEGTVESVEDVDEPELR